ncbi:MAG: uracil-DNA glycosylase [candidate division Zixibacteria bacterium]
MTDQTRNIQSLLRQALIAQVDLGLGEVILNKQNSERQADQVYNSVGMDAPISQAPASNASEVATANMIVHTSPQYESLVDHVGAIDNCQQCSLGKTRNKFVYGVGCTTAKLMFVGEAPGADEDRLGEPFVGRAGKLLDKILGAMQLDRDSVYIANILKCRPPSNRDPQPDEMDCCMPYLHEQIRLIKPSMICALGRIAAQALLSTKTPLGRLRGQWHEFENVPLLVTYHPAALLRFAQYKKETWKDMQLIMARMQEL